MGLLQSIEKYNRKLFTSWSFLNNRKLILIWCNGIVIFYLLNMIFPKVGYGNFTFILAILFLIIEIGEIMSQKRPKTESDNKDKSFKLGRLEIIRHRKKEDNEL